MEFTSKPDGRGAERSHAPLPVPSAEQLAAARSTRWHQDGNSLLTVEAARAWLNRQGLVLYAPRAQQLGAPAPTFVEATLGKANTAAELTEMDAAGLLGARTLLARLIAEGSAVPLNLLGASGALGTDVPDFVVSAGVFSYVFTLRGNKAWKQMPQTSGAVKVSPLALATYEMLSAKVTMSAYDLATQLGKEVTEGAVLRALTELWAQLRVIPVAQVDDSGAPGATLWELTTGRFTKQIKSGANAGQPTALSALISLYLGQAVLATEDEIESFLSPLAARSRVRDVIHALLPARQLETVVIGGKTLLHVNGDALPFASSTGAEHEVSAAPIGEDKAASASSRITKFKPKPGGKIGTGMRGKPLGRPGLGDRPAFGGKPGTGRGPDRERRPFQREDRPASPRPSYSKPWEEDRRVRPAGTASDGTVEGVAASDGSAPKRPFVRKSFSDRPGFGGSRPAFGDKPRFERQRDGEAAGGGARPPRREFPSRSSAQAAEGGSERPARKTFSKPGTFGRKRESSTGSPAFGSGSRPTGQRGGGSARGPRPEGGGRPDRPGGGEFKRPGSYAPRPSGGSAGGRSSGPRPSSGSDRGEASSSGDAPRKVFRKFDAPREKKPFGAKPFNSDDPKRSFGPPRPAGGRSFDKPREGRSGAGFGERSTSERPRSARPSSGERAGPSERKTGGPGGGKPAFGGRGTSGKAPFNKAGGPFAKFADGNKPFRKPGPGKPSGPKRNSKPDGGFKPTKRRPAGNS